MPFKKDWEKRDEHDQLAPYLIEGMVQWALPRNKLISYEVISGGCSNLNIKVKINDYELPLLLRVYFGGSDASYIERSVTTLLHPIVPVPRTYYIGNHEGYHFAIMEFLQGISLRDLLLSDQPYDVGIIMQEVGIVLSKITSHQFPKAGFFDRELHVTEAPANYLPFLHQCLLQPTVLAQFESETLLKINHYLEKQAPLFPSQEEKNLVHGDFDPANILVDKMDGVWKVTAVLDWEFSFSGSVLCDVANMLRYRHRMPPLFETAFLEGLQHGAIRLPHDWHERIDLLNLLALLDCLARTDPVKSPLQCADIVALTKKIIT